MSKSKNSRKQTKKSVKQSKAQAVVEQVPPADNMGIVTGLDADKNKWFWTAREGKVEHYACADEFDDQGAAEKAGAKWLAQYAKASDAAKRKLLGWKAPGTAGASVASGGSGGVEPGAKAEKKAGRTKAAKEDKPKKVSLIGAAFSVLSKSPEPMNCKAMVEAVTAQGLWSAGKGKTPEATLYSAILRETKKDGKNCRFNKTDRGHFTANLAAAKEA